MEALRSFMTKGAIGIRIRLIGKTLNNCIRSHCESDVHFDIVSTTEPSVQESDSHLAFFEALGVYFYFQETIVL